MKREKTNAIVYGAMLLAIFGVFIVLDTYTGAMFNVLFYYLMPLPFIVYGLKHGLKMMACQGVGAVLISFFFGLPETIFFTISAFFISVILVEGISKKWNSGFIFLSVLVVTAITQLLSVTVLATLFGYDIVSEVNEVKAFLGINGDLFAYALPLFVMLMGGLEAFIFTSLCDIVLFRLKIQRIPKFSIVQMHLPRKVGYACLILIFAQFIVQNDFFIFLGISSLIVLECQGLSFLMLYNLRKGYSPFLHILYFIMCFVPGVNLLIASIGLFDIFSEKRQVLLYNKTNV